MLDNVEVITEYIVNRSWVDKATRLSALVFLDGIII